MRVDEERAPAGTRADTRAGLTERELDRGAVHNPGNAAGWPDPLRPLLGLADFVAGGARREAFLRHLKTEVPRDVRDVVMTGFFAALPLPVASRIGAWLGRKVGESLIRSKGVRLKRIHDNLRLIRPDMPEPITTGSCCASTRCSAACSRRCPTCAGSPGTCGSRANTCWPPRRTGR